jgi:hypothetical protein
MKSDYPLGVIKTRKQAEDYAALIKEATGKDHETIVVQPGTQAYALGYRFATMPKEAA